MTDSLYRLVYLSRNDILGNEDDMQAEIDGILAKSRHNNARVGVTGALMFNTGCFAQVLEGGHDAIQATFERIQEDMRHSRVQVLAFESVEQRGFSHWAMAYVGQNAQRLEQFARFAEASNFDGKALQGDHVYALLQQNLQEAERP